MNRLGTIKGVVILVGTIALFSLTGCKSSKKVGTVESSGAKAHNEFFAAMQEQEFRFNTLSARLNVDLNLPGKEMSSRVDLKMIKDSVFQLSVQPLLGIEVFRIELSVDSVKVLDRMNKRYVCESYAGLKGQTPIDFNFYNLQALLTNHLFLPGHQAILPKQYNRFKLQQEEGLAEIKTKDSMGLLYTFTADGEEKLLSTHISEPSDKYTLQWNYQDFRLADKQPFPMLMDIQLQENDLSKGQVKIGFSRIQTDVALNMDFSIPSKYKRITFAQIIKAISTSSN